MKYFELKPYQPMSAQKTSLPNKDIVLFPIIRIVKKLYITSAVSFSQETTKLLC